MALKVDRTKTYDRILVDPEEGDEYKVSYRKLSHGEVERTRKAATKIKGKGRKQTVDYDSKAANYSAVRQSIVEWEIPFEPTPEDLDETDTWLLSQVFGHISELTPALATQLQAFLSEDEDDDEDDETDDEDGKANMDAVKANGYAEEDQAQVFTEDTGPTLHAATS